MKRWAGTSDDGRPGSRWRGLCQIPSPVLLLVDSRRFNGLPEADMVPGQQQILPVLAVAVFVSCILAQDKSKRSKKRRDLDTARIQRIVDSELRRRQEQRIKKFGSVDRMKQEKGLLLKSQLIWERREREQILRELAMQHVRLSEYRRALNRLTQATEKLKRMPDTVKSRKVVDEIERILFEVRRALWKLEPTEKQKAKDPAKKHGDQRNPYGVRIHVPVLAVPIRLDLKWPVLSEATDPKDKLFFSFRRF